MVYPKAFNYWSVGVILFIVYVLDTVWLTPRPSTAGDLGSFSFSCKFWS